MSSDLCVDVRLVNEGVEHVQDNVNVPHVGICVKLRTIIVRSRLGPVLAECLELDIVEGTRSVIHHHR